MHLEMWHLLPWQGLFRGSPWPFSAPTGLELRRLPLPGLALSMLVLWILALKAWWCCLHFQAALLPLSPQPPLLPT